MELRELSVDDGMDIYEMLQRIGAEENAFHNDVNGMTFDEYKQWLVKQASWANGDSLPQGYVKQWTFWLYDNDKPVGYGKLREKLTDSSREFGGNIGYAIDSECRGKGYGYLLFSSLIEKAREIGIKEIMSTVEKNNIASKTIQEKCGGVLIKENEDRWFFSFDSIL